MLLALRITTQNYSLEMGNGELGMGHGAWGMGHGALGIATPPGHQGGKGIGHCFLLLACGKGMEGNAENRLRSIACRDDGQNRLECLFVYISSKYLQSWQFLRRKPQNPRRICVRQLGSARLWWQLRKLCPWANPF